MLKLSLLNHYEYNEFENGYYFLTDSGNKYIITFIKYPLCSDELPMDVFMFNIDRTDEGNHKNGDKQLVRNTIANILMNFFKYNENAIITVCDIYDDRQLCRKRLFDGWYEQLGKDYIKKVDATIDIEGTQTYANLFYAYTNSHIDELIKGFNALANENFYN